jgi:hypothetical protein
MRSTLSLALVVSALFVCFRHPSASYGAILLTVAESPYTQDFNTLANVGTSSALPFGFTTSAPAYQADLGSSSVGGIKSYGGIPNVTDRAIGSLGSYATGVLYFGAEFENATGLTITALDIGFAGEQWRSSGNAICDMLRFEYSLNATSLTDGSANWTSVGELDFKNPIPTPSPRVPNGNVVPYRTDLNALIDGLQISQSSSFWSRWRDEDISGEDYGLAIDDFSLVPLGESFTPENQATGLSSPEPSSLIAWSALTILASIFRYRRRTATMLATAR